MKQSRTLDRHIQVEDICSKTAQALIHALNSELIEQYPEVGSAQHFRLDPDEVVEGQGAFLVAYVRGQAQGCGAIRKLNTTQAEIKRVFVKSEARGTGLGTLILADLEVQALKLGVQELLLETGPRQNRLLPCTNKRDLRSERPLASIKQIH